MDQGSVTMIRSKIPIVTFMLAALPAMATAQACPDPAAIAGGAATAEGTVRFLADDALEGREAGSAGERCAGEFIADQFRRLGLEPAGADGSYFTEVGLASALNPHAPGGTGRNVVAMLEGRDPALRDQYVIIGAHYDHLGRGGAGSLAGTDTGQIHNGADDNASGVAGVLLAAELLTAGEPPARSIVFVAFTGEEMGLLGSARFVADSSIPPSRMRAMLNLDMVGRLGSDPLIVYGTGTADEWTQLVEAAGEGAGVELVLNPEGYGPSDHTSFYARDVPVLHFFTNVHGDYHRPSDDWEKVDLAGIDKVARMVVDIARAVANSEAPLTLVRGAGSPPGRSSEPSGYGAYLGSVPDFTPVDHGVRLSGVSPGSPAEHAGIAAGDVIVKFGAHEVADLQGLTDALRAHRPGDVVDVVVLRDGDERTFRVELGSRSSR